MAVALVGGQTAVVGDGGFDQTPDGAAGAQAVVGGPDPTVPGVGGVGGHGESGAVRVGVDWRTGGRGRGATPAPAVGDGWRLQFAALLKQKHEK